MLPSDDETRALVRTALDALSGAGADEAEVHVRDGVDATTRFATDGITQNVLTRSGTLSVRAVVGRRSGRATTTSFLADDVRAAAARALAAARVAAEDPEHLPVPDPEPIPDVRPFDARALAETPGDRAARVAEAAQAVRAADLRPAGTATTGAELVAIGNSRGLFACHRDAQSGFALTAFSDTSAGFAERNAAAPQDLDVAAVTATAIDKARRSVDPIAVPPGEYAVVFEPSAVTEVLLFLGGIL